ncbi:hypothetical protein [Microbacterium phyllosphaerae]
MKINLDLGHASSRLVDRGRLLGGIDVTGTASGPSVTVGGSHTPLRVVERAAGTPDPESIPPGFVGLVIDRSISRDDRERLEQSGLSWWDLRGAVHLQFDNLLVHIDRTPARSGAPARSQHPHLGPVGTRAAQTLLIRDDVAQWSVSELSALADVSVGQAHTVLTRLEDLGFVESIGRGRSKKRLIGDREGALDWLRTSESRLRTPSASQSYLYARNEMDLVRKFDALAGRAGIRYAVTSSMGARLWGVPVTTSVITRVRVDTNDLDAARETMGLPFLDADEAGRGANVELWSDKGEVGTHDAVDIDGVSVAPQIRVWLDLARQGGRYEDGADLLREQIIERT